MSEYFKNNPIKTLNIDQSLLSEGDNKIGNAYVDLGVNLSPLEAGLIAGLGALEAYFVAAYSKMDTAMRNIWTITNISQGELKEIQENILALTREVPQSASQLAAGYYNIVSSGIDTADAMSVLEIAAKSASASLTDTDTAVRGLSYVLNAYSMDAEEAGRVADIMFRGVDKGVMTFGQLANSVGTYANSAAAAGVSLEEVIAAHAAITKTGFSADEAATALNQTLMAFIKPGKEMASWATDMGYDSALAALQAMGLAEAMERISLATRGSADQMTLFFPNVRALRGALALARGDGQDFNEILNAMENSTGALDRAFALQEDSVANSGKMLKNAVEDVSIQMGEAAAPAFNALADGLTSILNSIAELSPDSFKIIQAGLGIGALYTAFQTIEAILPRLMTLMGAGPGGLMSLFTASNPLGWIVLGAAALVAINEFIIQPLTDWEGQAKDTAKANDDAIKSLTSLAKANFADIQDLTELITIYEEYMSKATLTTEEQKKLNDVINKIESIAPGVVTSWDSMGNAMTINVESAKAELLELWRVQLTYAEGVKDLADMQYDNSKDARTKLLAEKDVLNKELELFRQVKGLNAKIAYDDTWEKRRAKAVEAINKGQIKTYEDLAKFMGDGWGQVTDQLLAVKKLIDSGTGDWWKLQGASLNETLSRIGEWSSKDLTAKKEEEARTRLIEVQNSLNVFNDYATKAAAAAMEVDNLTKAVNELKKAMDDLDAKKLEVNVKGTPGAALPGEWRIVAPGASQQASTSSADPLASFKTWTATQQGQFASLTGGVALGQTFSDWRDSVEEFTEDWEYAYNETEGVARDLLSSGNDFLFAIDLLSEGLLEYDGKLLQNLGKGLEKFGSKLGSVLSQLGGDSGLLGMSTLMFTNMFKGWDWIMKLLKIGPYAAEMSDGWKKFWEFLGYDFDKIDNEEENRPAFQISEISGPMRDSIVTALDPLKILYSYPTYKDEIVAAINGVRDVLLGSPTIGTTSALSGIQQTFNIQQVNIVAADQATFSSILSDLDKKVRLAAVGVGG